MENTPFTVQHLLQMPLFREAKIIGGQAGVTNEIYYIDSMEMPDLTGWLRPNELILTTGYSFRHEPTMLCGLLDEMHRVGGSAVGIKTRRFLQEVPEEAIYKSNLYNIPLFDIPLEVPFMDMTRSILDQILQRQAYMLRELREVNQQFTNLVLNRRTTELVILIGQLLQCEAAVVNSQEEIESGTLHFAKANIAEKHDVRVGSRKFGYLAITRKLGEQDHFEISCLEHAVTVLALEFTIRQSQQLHLEREQEAFLVELLSGSNHQEELLNYRAKRLGIPLGPFPYVIVMKHSSSIAMDNEKINNLNHWLLREINNPGSFARKGIEINGQLLILCHLVHKDIDNQRKETEQFVKDLLTKANHHGFNEDIRFVCGMGSFREQISEISDSCREAQKALAIGEISLPKQMVVHIKDVLVEQLLMDTSDHHVLNVLYEEFIAPLEVYDQEFGANLLITLEAYLRLGSNTKQVAEELFIHRNSVLYRLERIREILQKDLSDAEVHLRLVLAIRFWKLKRARGK
ncbi:PucR family transcriptional regulator ligand-binding domain-containing protein [Paenibacillus sp. HWE-109]|uniref:PucR family transcriptional regulator n=1 Tax=Paenibacillus sp. HWE-109 TaxID=1306526 RepID=UPI001EDE68F6|nr:PucR family transcriptional regulator ligand-binding domain-containing protein [Paenibacillus sp. HWE-109]UKS29342.1 PucR family transcriptional regulator ligand-binding domain-containing protein [Paenibacillus sp. HWE-109]